MKRILLPQNNEYVCTKELVAEIADVQGKSIRFIRGLSPIFKTLIGKNRIVTKLFGSLYYNAQIDLCDTFSFTESVHITEQDLAKPIIGLGGQKC